MDSFPDAPLPRPEPIGIVLHERVGTTAAGELWIAHPVAPASEADAPVLVELLTRTIAADRAAIASGVEELWALRTDAGVLEGLAPPAGFVSTEQGAGLQLALLPVDPGPEFRANPAAGRQAARALAASVAELHAAGRIHGSIGPAVLGRAEPDGPLLLAMTTTTALNGRAPDDDVTALVELIAPWLDAATANRARSHAILGTGIGALVLALDEPFTPGRGGGTARTLLPESAWLALRSRRRGALVAVIGVAVAALIVTGSVLSATRNSPPSSAPAPLSGELNPLTGGHVAAPTPDLPAARSFAFPEVQAAGPGGVTARVQRTWRVSPSQPSLLLVEVAVEAPGTTGGTVAVGDALSPAVAPAATAVDTLGTPAQVGVSAPVQLHWDLMLGPNGQAVTTYTVALESPADDAAAFASLVRSEQAVPDGLSLTVVTPSPPASSAVPATAAAAPTTASPTPVGSSSAPAASAAPTTAAAPPAPTPLRPEPPAPSIVTGTISIPS